MRVRFVYRRGVEDELAKERGTLEALDDAGDRIATAAKGYAPVRTGRYRSSIVVGRDSGISVVRATAPYAFAVEWDTDHTEGKHPLAKAVETVSRSF